MKAGLQFARQSVLIARALAVMQERPSTTQALAREVFSLCNAPPGLVARLLFELLGSDRRAVVDARGVWRLTTPEPRLEGQPLACLPYAVVDVETTGGSPSGGGRIIEIAAIEVRDGSVSDEFCTLVNPGCGVPPFVARLTGISTQMVQAAPLFEEVCDELLGRLEGRVFVAHNAVFDWRFVAEEVRRARAVVPQGPCLCTVRLVRRALPGLRRRSLDAVARYYGLDVEARHRASGDARATAAVLLRLLGDLERRGITDWGDLQRWLHARRVPVRRRSRTRRPRSDGGRTPGRGEPVDSIDHRSCARPSPPSRGA